MINAMYTEINNANHLEKCLSITIENLLEKCLIVCLYVQKLLGEYFWLYNCSLPHSNN